MLKLAPFVGNFSNKTCELSASYCFTFSSPEAAILLVSTENHNLWPAPTPEVRDSRTSRYSAHALSQVWQIWLVLVSMYCVYKAIRNQNVVGPGQRSWFSVLTKRIAASGDENGIASSLRQYRGFYPSGSHRLPIAGEWYTPLLGNTAHMASTLRFRCSFSVIKRWPRARIRNLIRKDLALGIQNGGLTTRKTSSLSWLVLERNVNLHMGKSLNCSNDSLQTGELIRYDVFTCQL